MRSASGNASASDAGPRAAYRNILRAIEQGANSPGPKLVAYSGGVDSSVVAWGVREAFGKDAIACLGVSPALPDGQRALARDVAGRIGIALREIDTHEYRDDEYRANRGLSCYRCKDTLYDAMRAAVPPASQDERTTLFNGTNTDDLSDPTRTGLIAAREHGVVSPLATSTKAEVRAVARMLGLPHWNRAASPCLRSRLAAGIEATPGNLRRIGEAERRLRAAFSIPPDIDFRVRHLVGDAAAIEIAEEALDRIDLRTCARELLPLGFVECTTRVYRSGAVSSPPIPIDPASMPVSPRGSPSPRTRTGTAP